MSTCKVRRITRKKPHRDHLVPLRKKSHRRRYIVPNPVVAPEAVRAKRRKAARKRKRKIALLTLLILNAFESQSGVVLYDRILAILERAI